MFTHSPESEKPLILVVQQTSSPALSNVLSEKYNIKLVPNIPPQLYFSPACILINADVRTSDAFEQTKRLKSHFSTMTIPVLLARRDHDEDDFERAVAAGIDGYLLFPCSKQTLLAHIAVTINRSLRDLHANPLTRLPGAATIYQQLKNRMIGNAAILYIDINQFKRYNDIYGFDAGNKIIVETAELLAHVLLRHGSPDDFLGHIGGDDFLILTNPIHSPLIAHTICQRFDAVHHNAGLSVTVTSLTLKKEKLRTIPYIAQKIATLMRQAKNIKSTKSTWVQE